MKSWPAIAIGLVCAATAGGAALASDQLRGSAPSISGDEQEVYETVLASWLSKEQGRQRVSVDLSPPPSISDPEFSECAKGLSFLARTPGEQGQKTLVGVKFIRSDIELIEGSRWSPVDPGQQIAKGSSVESAVKEGVSHSLISLSQVAFSRSGNDALVKFGMVCGRLCGTGSTIHLHKSKGHWVILNRCGGWIS